MRTSDAATVCRLREETNGRSFTLADDGLEGVSELGYNRQRTVSTGPYHTHRDCVELIFCLGGTCVYETPEGKFSFKAGTVFMTRPGQPHVLRVYHKNLRFHWIRFRVRHLGAPFLGLPPDESAWLVRRLGSMPRQTFPGGDALKGAFRRVFRLCESGERKGPETVLRLRLALLDLALKVVDAGECLPHDQKNGSMERLAERMRRSPGESYSVRALAGEAGLSVAGFITSFKRQTGYSPHAFLLACRIERAKRLLRTGTKVSVTANMMGFSTQKRFSAYFRQAVGRSPREWAKGS